MERIPSGGVGGPNPLDPALHERDNNLYGTLAGPLDIEALAWRLVEAGWYAARSSWYEYEVSARWCSFELTPQPDDVLLAGVVAEESLDWLARVLADLGTRGSLELYDDEKNLLRRLTFH